MTMLEREPYDHRPPASGRPCAILYVHNATDIYGASRCLLRMVSGLDPSRFVPVVALPGEGPLSRLLGDLGVPVVVEPSICIIDRQTFHPRGLARLATRFPASVRRLCALIKRWRIDVVHSNTGVILSAAPAARLAGVPHVWHVRESFAEFRALWPLFARYILGLSDRVVAVSNAVADQFPASRKLSVVHDGLELSEAVVDRPRLGAEFRRRYGLGDGPVVGCVGRIKWVRKGQEDLVEAAALLKGRGVRGKYLIVGAPFPGNEEHLERLRRLIATRGLEHDVVLAGELADVAPAYAAMDVLVLPSAQPEPFGMVLLEAMAQGLPVVATRQGGPLDVVEEGRTGFLVPPSDPEALAQPLAALIGDGTMRQALGAAGRERLNSHFTVRTTLAAIEAIYTSLRPVAVSACGTDSGREFIPESTPDARAGCARCAPVAQGGRS